MYTDPELHIWFWYSFADNHGLCGISGLPACGQHLTARAKIGIGLLVCAVLLLIVIGSICCWKRRLNILKVQQIAGIKDVDIDLLGEIRLHKTGLNNERTWNYITSLHVTLQLLEGISMNYTNFFKLWSAFPCVARHIPHAQAGTHFAPDIELNRQYTHLSPEIEMSKQYIHCIRSRTASETGPILRQRSRSV